MVHVKKLFYIIILLSVSLPGLAKQNSASQLEEDELYLFVGAGPAYPQGIYNSSEVDLDKKYEDYKAGNASLGYNFNISVLTRLHKLFGMAVDFTGRANPLDESTMEDQIGDDLNQEISLKTTQWNYYSLSIGIIGGFQLFEGDVDINPRILGGYTYTLSPEIKQYDVSGETTIPMSEANTKHALSLNYKVGMLLRVYVSSHVAISAYADYFETKPRFNGYLYLGKPSQRISNFDVGIGLSFNLF